MDDTVLDCWTYWKRSVPWKMVLALIAIGVCFQIPTFGQISRIDSLQRELATEQNPSVRVDVLLELAYELRIVNVRLIPPLVDEAMALLESRDIPKSLAFAYHIRGVERWLNGYYPEAESSYRHSIRIYSELGDSAMLATNFSYLGLSYLYHAEYDTALFYFHQAFALNEKLGAKHKMAHNLDNIAVVHHYRANYPEVVKNTERSIQIRRTIDGHSGRTNLYKFGGEVFAQKALDEALLYHKESLEQELLKKDGNIGAILNNIGSTFYNAHQYDSAIAYLRAGANETRKLGIPYRYAGHLNELGEALSANGNYEKAETIFLEVRDIWDSVGTRHSVTIIHSNLALLYLKMGEYGKGIEYVDTALDLCRSMGYNPFMSQLEYQKAKLLIRQGEVESAKVLAQQALQKVQSIGIIESILDGYLLLQEICTRTGEFQEALSYADQYKQLKEEQYNGESAITLAKLQVTFETDRKNKEIELLNAQTEIQDARILQRELLIAGAIIALLAITFYLVKRQKYMLKLTHQYFLIDKQRTQLLAQNHEKDLLLGEIHHRVKNNLQLISSILNLQSRKLSDSGAKEAVQEGRNRVKAMALIHQQLYQHDRFANVQVNDYLFKLIKTIAGSFGYAQDDFELIYEVEDIHLDVDKAIQIGLISNELICNVFKHAFRNQGSDKLWFNVRSGDNSLILEIRDNGPGTRAPKLQKPEGFGMYLIKNLVEDLKGTIEITSSSGMHIFISIKSVHTQKSITLTDDPVLLKVS